MTDRPNTSPFDADALLAEIRAWVEIESPTTDAAAVNRMTDRVEAVPRPPARARAASPAATVTATTSSSPRPGAARTSPASWC